MNNLDGYGRGWGAITGWAEDFILALKDRPLIFRILFRLIVGKSAYREFVGLVDALDIHTAGLMTNRDIGYELDNMPYHKESVRWKWWEHK